MQQLPAGSAATLLDPDAVRDTIAQVFLHAGYDQSLRQSLGDRLLSWLARWITTAVDAIRASADVRWIVIAIAALVVATVLARAVWLSMAQARHAAGIRSRAVRRGPDPWKEAAELAARGRHTEAAHLLYLASLEAVARRHRIALHPARTAGEYERELRARGSTTLPAFTAFVSAYEREVWRSGAVDSSTWERLHALAAAVVHPVPQQAAA